MWAIAIGAATLVVSTLVLQHYLVRSQSSLRKASKVWTDLVDSVDKVVKDPTYPMEMVNLAVAVVELAGCGCLVRGVLLDHYLPWLPSKRHRERPPTRTDSAYQRLPTKQKQHMGMIFGQAVVFDGFSNPLQGWLFRRMVSGFAISTVKNPKALPPEGMREAKTVTMQKASRKVSSDQGRLVAA